MSNYRAKKGRKRVNSGVKSGKIKKVIRKQKRNAILKNRVFWDMVLGIVLVISFTYLVFFSQAFEIRDVSVAASSELSHIVLGVKQDISQSALNKSFFAIRAKPIKQKILENHPEVEALIVKRIFPDKLFVDLKERAPVGIWCYNETDCFLFDKQGVIFKTIAATANDLPLIRTQNQTELTHITMPLEVISAEKLAQIIEINNVFQNDLPVDVSFFITDSEETLNVRTEQGLEVYFILGGDLNTAITRLKLLFEKELTDEIIKNLEYIDLRFSKVYYK